MHKLFRVERYACKVYRMLGTLKMQITSNLSSLYNKQNGGCFTQSNRGQTVVRNLFYMYLWERHRYY